MNDKLRQIPTAKAPLATLTLLLAEYEKGDPRRMPFVRNLKVKGRQAAGRSFWRPAEAFPDESPAAQGMLCAGAYLQYTLNEGPGRLSSIVAAMPQPLTECELHFFFIVEKYIHQAVETFPSLGRHIETLTGHLRAFEVELLKHNSGDVVRRIATALNTTALELHLDRDERGVAC